MTKPANRAHFSSSREGLPRANLLRETSNDSQPSHQYEDPEPFDGFEVIGQPEDELITPQECVCPIIYPSSTAAGR
jgi:hypothetical protein